MVEFMLTLGNQKQALLEKWLERTLATYPRQTLDFLHDEKDRFRNPVGHTLREGLATLLDELTGEMDAAKIRPALESIVRLRAVQDFTPSQAVGFVYLLREILDEELAGERNAAILAAQSRSGGLTPPWRGEPAATSGGTWAVQRRIDELALLAFDLFMKCREEIFEIKAREARRQTYVAERMVRSQRGEGT
jgi:hypothetical protein